MLTPFKRLRQHHQRLFALIIAIGVILLWRGMWGLADLHIFPNNELYSYSLSVAIGLIILISSHYMIKEFSVIPKLVNDTKLVNEFIPYFFWNLIT